MERTEEGKRRGNKVGVAITGSKKSKYILNWALDKFAAEQHVKFILIHVFPKITAVPTPLGNWIPITKVRDDVATGYRKELFFYKNKKILPYQYLCRFKKVQAEILLIESDEIANAISMEIAKCEIRYLVIGASSNSLFSRKALSVRKLMGENLPAMISESTPSFCTVFTVSDGKMQYMRPSDSDTNGYTFPDDAASFSSGSSDSSSSLISHSPGHLLLKSAPSSPRHTETASGRAAFDSRSLTTEELKTAAKDSIQNSRNGSDEFKLNKYSDTRAKGDARSSGFASSSKNKGANGGSRHSGSRASSQSSSSGSYVGTSSSDPINMSSEIAKLRMELRHIELMYAMASNEGLEMNHEQRNSSKQREQEAEKIKEMARDEMKKSGAAKSDAQREVYQREETQEVEEKEKLKALLASPVQRYQKFTWEEIVSATSAFSDDLKIGLGAFGTVYKCKLHHTTAAIKVLRDKDGPANKQFFQELEILSRIRHPHLLMLLGACPEESCLVYEYMENGSLEDRLFRKKDTPPIPWFERYRIAWEVASALVYLHSTKPKPIIHRDLKPANILLDRNFVSKIGDVGLGTMITSEPTSMSLRTVYKETNPVGTLCYIDPEYQRTGKVSTKSDIYALGVVILQLLTAKSAVGIADVVEDALDEGNFMEMLDTTAGKWPPRETTELAQLALKCAELRGRDRPDLRDRVLPALERLKQIADAARGSSSVAPPSHFICPMLKDVMEDPCVAADGYTYDHKAIEQWLTENDTSPTTSFPLAHKFLTPNFTLLYAIREWKSRRQTS